MKLTWVIFSAVSGWGHRVGCLSTSSLVIVESNCLNSVEIASSTSSLSLSSKAVREGGARADGRWIFPTEETKATISMP